MIHWWCELHFVQCNVLFVVSDVEIPATSKQFAYNVHWSYYWPLSLKQDSHYYTSGAGFGSQKHRGYLNLNVQYDLNCVESAVNPQPIKIYFTVGLDSSGIGWCDVAYS